MVDSQLSEGEAQGAELRGTRTGSQERPSEPTLLPRVTLPSALTRKNTNVWKTVVRRSGTDEKDGKLGLQKESHLFCRPKNLGTEIKAKLRESRVPLVGFSEEDRNEELGGRGIHNPFDDKVPYGKRNRNNGTDIAKITRKRSKPDKHEHENGKRAPNDWIASVAIRVLYSHPTATKLDPMIRGIKSCDHLERVEDLEASLISYK
ncbi:hypothetical protein Tco_0872866 [Tanacetum coccineum]